VPGLAVRLNIMKRWSNDRFLSTPRRPEQPTPLPARRLS
jgi:hypothetical protein